MEVDARGACFLAANLHGEENEGFICEVKKMRVK